MDRYLDRPGARLAYGVQDGDDAAPLVVALHGLTSSRAVEDADGSFGWGPVASRGRTLVRYDARGHGRSTGEPEPDDYTWAVLADDLLGLLDHLAPGEPVDAIGVSMGVGTLLHAAVRAPGRFRRLALVLPPTAWATRPAQRRLYGDGARFVEERGAAAFARGLAAAPTPPVLAEGGWTVRAPDVPEALLPALLRGAGASDLPDEETLAGVAAEVLLRPWVGDPAHPLSTAERLAALLPSATLEVTRTADDLRGLGARVADFLD